jgi:exonuclease V gamma subunit
MDESKKSTEKTSNLKPWENYLKEAKHYKTTTHQYKKLLADAYNSYAAYRQGDDWDAEFDDPNKLKDLRKKVKEDLKSEKE